MPNLTPNERTIADALTMQATVEKAWKESKPPAKLCDIKDVLPKSVIQMAESFPQNETVRSVLCAHLKIPVPPEHQTFQQIRDWIEATIDLKKVTTPLAPSHIMVPITASAREVGRCHYSGRVSGAGNVKFSDADIMYMVAEADDMDSFWEAMRDSISDTGGAGLVNMEAEDGYDYSDHEETDMEDSEWEFGRGSPDIVKAAIRRLNPEKADEWGI